MQRGTGCGFSRALNIPQADKVIWELVKSIHRKSSTLKEDVKQRVLKEGGVFLRSNTELKALDRKIKKLQRDSLSLNETLGNLEANRLISNMNDAVYMAAATRIKDSIAQTDSELEKARGELLGTKQSKKWVDWLKAFGDEIDRLDGLNDEERKKYIMGLVKRIDVRYSSEQREHELTVTMHLPIINDGIRYTGQGKEAKTYVVVSGTDTATVTTKKKDGRG